MTGCFPSKPCMGGAGIETGSWELGGTHTTSRQQGPAEQLCLRGAGRDQPSLGKGQLVVFGVVPFSVSQPTPGGPAGLAHKGPPKGPLSIIAQPFVLPPSDKSLEVILFFPVFLWHSLCPTFLLAPSFPSSSGTWELPLRFPPPTLSQTRGLGWPEML